MTLAKGEKVHVMTRRKFEGDLRRHFVGEVEEATESVVRLKGFAFIFDEATNEFVRREEQRVRVLPLLDAGLIINVIPRETDLNELRYLTDERNRRVITDGKSFIMNVSEFGARR